MVSNTGTYIDCPFHRYADGRDLSETDLERFVDLPAVLVRVPWRERLEVTPRDFVRVDVGDEGRARAIRDGASTGTRTRTSTTTRTLQPRPPPSCAVPVHCSWASTPTTSMTRAPRTAAPCKRFCWGLRILIVEHLCGLDQLPLEGFLFSAVPPKFKGVGTFPVRAYASLGKWHFLH